MNSNNRRRSPRFTEKLSSQQQHQHAMPLPAYAAATNSTTTKFSAPHQKMLISKSLREEKNSNTNRKSNHTNAATAATHKNPSYTTHTTTSNPNKRRRHNAASNNEPELVAAGTAKNRFKRKRNTDSSMSLANDLDSNHTTSTESIPQSVVAAGTSLVTAISSPFSSASSLSSSTVTSQTTSATAGGGTAPPVVAVVAVPPLSMTTNNTPAASVEDSIENELGFGASEVINLNLAQKFNISLTEASQVYLKSQLIKARVKFDKACRQLTLLNQHINDLQNSYFNSLETDKKTFKIVYRMQLATLEGTHTAYIEYIERQVDKIRKFKRLLFSESASDLDAAATADTSVNTIPVSSQ
jgi:hypothetical protein